METRQVRRARERTAAKKLRKPWQPDTPGRERTSCNVIAAHTPRKRLSPKPPSPYLKGLKHAWQRKIAALSGALGAH